MTRKEKKLILIAGVIFAIFMLAKVIPFVKNYYQQQVAAIEEIKIKKQQFEKLAHKADFWEAEYKNLRTTRKRIYKASLLGDTPELISANIQSILKNRARKAGIQFKSMELGESAVVGEWVLVTQAMQFEANSETFFNFLKALDESKAELIVTDLDIRSYRGKLMGKIKVSGFSHPPLKEVKPKEEIPAPTEEIVKEGDHAIIEQRAPEIPQNISETPENTSETPENIVEGIPENTLEIPENSQDELFQKPEIFEPESGMMLESEIMMPESEIIPEFEVPEDVEGLIPSEDNI